MHVHCVHCGGQIPADDLNVATAIAKCRACDAVFSFADAIQQDEDGPRRAVGPARALELPQPKGLEVEDWSGNLRITRRWFSAKIIFLAFFCVFWDGFLVFWYEMAIGQNAPAVMIVFPMIHVAVGVGLTYFTLCGFVNRTVILIEAGRLSVQHMPLPWPGNRVLDTTDLSQLYCRRRITHSRNGTSESYQLHVLTKAGGTLKLIGGIDDPEQALFLEQRIEKYLGIAQRAVPGEFRG